MANSYGTFSTEQTSQRWSSQSRREPTVRFLLSLVTGVAIALCSIFWVRLRPTRILLMSSTPVQQLEGGMSATEWGSYDPITGVPRLLCSDTVAKADSTRMIVIETGKRTEFVSPRNRFYGSKTYPPQGVGLSKPGYTPDQEADAFCTDASGASGKTKNQGCPDPCAYSLCNEGQTFIVQCPRACFGTSDAKPVYGQYDRERRTVVAPYEDQSSICRAAILAGVDPTMGKENFYATVTILRPVRSYQDELGAWTQFERWDEAQNPASWPSLNVDVSK